MNKLLRSTVKNIVTLKNGKMKMKDFGLLKKSSIAFVVMVLSLNTAIHAQYISRMDIDFYTQEGQLLANALTGGLNAPQMSEVDLNNDGTMDLYIFERIGDKHLTFLNEGSEGEVKYVYAPEYETSFPPVEGWALLRDYNQDGAMDIFAYADQIVSGVMVYRGYYEDGKLKFERHNFDEQLNMIFFPLPSGGRTQLYVSEIDIPAIDDIDCDGDLDIVTFSVGGGYIDFFKNMSVEDGFGFDSLHFEMETNCFGGIFESGISNDLNLAASPGECYEGFVEETVDDRHSGSTLVTFDMNNDGAKELALGDISFTNLILLNNGGSCEETWFNEQEINFPAETESVDLPIFPAGYYLDMDNDGVKDMIVSPNSTNAAEDYNVMWFYKNTNTNEFPEFQLQQKDLMIEEMVDHGSGAKPAFVDYNADGLLDLVVGNYSYFVPFGDRDPRLFLYLNTGTESEPAFTLEDDDFLNMSQFSQSSYNYAPTFGDLDGDGDLDLIVGEEYGHLFYAENTAGAGNPMEFGTVTYNYFEINVGKVSTPQVVDLNRDGVKDLVIGEKNGNVNFFVNTGTPTAPEFNPDPAMPPNNFLLGEIDTRIPGYSTGHSAPFIYDSEDGYKLLTGSEIGRIEYYTNIDGNLEGAFTASADTFGGILEGIRTNLVLEDINNDGMLEMFVGNFRGGLVAYGTDIPKFINTSVYEDAKKIGLTVFPNPASESLIIRTSEFSDVQKEAVVYDVNGKVLLSQNWQGLTGNINISILSSGIYFVKVQMGDVVSVERFVKE